MGKFKKSKTVGVGSPSPNKKESVIKEAPGKKLKKKKDKSREKFEQKMKKKKLTTQENEDSSGDEFTLGKKRMKH